MNYGDQHNLERCVELALNHEHGDSSLVERAVIESIVDGIRHGYIGQPHYADLPPESYLRVAARHRAGGIVIWINMPSIAYGTIEMEAEPYDEYEFDRIAYWENARDSRAMRTVKWRVIECREVNRFHIPHPSDAHAPIRTPYKPSPPYRESVELLVNVLKEINKVWWFSVDDTTKRFMMLDMQPSKPTPPDTKDTIELEMS